MRVAEDIEVVAGKIYLAVTRKYVKGGRIELGIEDVAGYRLTYSDSVEADFDRTDEATFEFKFSTGFYGSFKEMGDGSYTL